MSSVSLPARANLTQLRKQARDLQRAVRAGSAPALAEVAEYYPGGTPGPAAAAQFPLHAARLVVSRRYGFSSWTRLKRYVETLEHYTRIPPDAGGDCSGRQRAASWRMSFCGWPASGTKTTGPSGGPGPGPCWRRTRN